DFHAKLADFGLSVLRNNTKTSQSKEEFKEEVGSLYSMAPELFNFPPDYSQSSDIYALGIVYYELATLLVPYHGFAADLIRENVKAGERMPINNQNKTIPQPFIDLINHCWVNDPKKRPSALDVLKFIYPFVSDQLSGHA